MMKIALAAVSAAALLGLSACAEEPAEDTTVVETETLEPAPMATDAMTTEDPMATDTATTADPAMADPAATETPMAEETTAPAM